MIKTVDNFFNQLATEIDKTYFPNVTYYRNNENDTKVHRTIELFNNGCVGYSYLINKLAKHCNEKDKNVIHSIVKKYIVSFGEYEYK